MWVLWVVLSIVLLILLILAIIIIRYIQDYWIFLDIPHEPPKSLFNVFQEMTGSRFSTIEEEQTHYWDLYQRFKGTAPFCGFYGLLQPRVLVLEQDLVNQILIKDFSNFNDRGIYHNIRLDPISSDLFSRNGSEWKEMRLKLDQIFSEDQIDSLFDTAYEECSRLLESFEHIISMDPSSSINVHHLIRRYVLNSIAINVFGIDKAMQAKYPLDEFETMAQLALTTLRHGNYLTTLLGRYQKTGRNLGFRMTASKVNTYFMALIEDIVNQREKFHMIRDDYLQLLINLKMQEYTTHETETNADGKELRQYLFNELIAHLFVFLKSGFRPTSKTLSFLLYELARNPEIQDHIREEVRLVISENNGELSYECLQKMYYLEQVITETIRYHPITPFLVRRTLSNYIVPNNTRYFMKKDMYVIIPIHAMHHDPNHFEDPHLFKPDRFSKKSARIRDSSVWLGFGGGPRSCIGIHFAQLLIRLAVAKLLLQYKFNLDSNQVMIKSFDTAILRVELLTNNRNVEYSENASDNDVDEFDDDDPDIDVRDDNGLVAEENNPEVGNKWI